MDAQWGKPLMERELDMKGVIIKRIFFMALGLGFLVGAVYIGLFMETYAAWASYVLMVVVALLGLAFFLGSFAFKKQHAILYEEGIFIAEGSKEYRLHFNEIVGLSDEAGQDISVSGGLVQVLVASAAVAVAGKIADAHNRKHRIRPINVWTKIDSKLKSLPIIKSVGDVLSQQYTEWLIQQKNITAENINTLTLSFGESFELANGRFVYTDVLNRVSEVNLENISEIRYEENNLELCTINEKGRTKPEIKIPITDVYNLDLLFYIKDLQNPNM